MIKNGKKQLKRQTRNSGTEKNSEKTQKCTDISSVFKISLGYQIYEGIAIILHYRRILIFSAEIDHFRKIKKFQNFISLQNYLNLFLKHL